MFSVVCCLCLDKPIRHTFANSALFPLIVATVTSSFVSTSLLQLSVSFILKAFSFASLSTVIAAASKPLSVSQNIWPSRVRSQSIPCFLENRFCFPRLRMMRDVGL